LAFDSTRRRREFLAVAVCFWGLPVGLLRIIAATDFLPEPK